MRRTSQASSRKSGLTRRKALKVLATIPAVLLPGGSADAETSDDGRWTGAGELSELATDLANWERNAVEGNYPACWQEMRYISVIEWTKGVFLCAGVCPPETSRAMFDAAQSRVEWSDACQFMASGWSDDRRVWTMLVKAPAGDGSAAELPGAVALLMKSVATDVDVWQQAIYVQDDPAGLIVKQIPVCDPTTAGKPAGLPDAGRACS